VRPCYEQPGTLDAPRSPIAGGARTLLGYERGAAAAGASAQTDARPLGVRRVETRS
jgi:hypothetical protein